MKQLVLLISSFFFFQFLFSQNTIQILVKNKKDSTNLSGASITIERKNSGTTTNEAGLSTIGGLANGNYSLHITAVNFNEEVLNVSLPDSSLYLVYLQPT